ncbi:hypothetical protein CHRY9390_02527 [Chryseobacterium aquaeductus]|uniref:DUF4238 domain-containing protein n=1 Tax=Chryseobacterium aquaeductus TaxID=2675056 RepID=A0A9N8QR97_9FLAO|nr:DUF4238 domain-containing protein [Chryseobacterium aquaeductus]CAA7331811.1 hypothetical protein CHRY9390_02527 [Chryseobacterium potabilaquae]CAD7812537.1 hypothetical protein CHRY9390_02527 [Chryseobacterium aquaeductus]
MNKAQNHHYVSQTHIKKFFNYDLKKIFIYDKRYGDIRYKNGTKYIFSEDNLNTMLIENEFDYATIENLYNKYFENDFNKNYKIVEKFINQQILDKDTENALRFFARYGVLGNHRTPEHKKEIADIFYFGLIEGLGDKILENQEFLKVAQPYGDKKYSNSEIDLEIPNIILDLMGDIFFTIYVPNSICDVFILSDYCSLTLREKTNKYLNTDITEISTISFPLSSKIFLEFYSTKSTHSPQKSEIKFLNSTEVELINKETLSLSYKCVVCSDENYLQNLIS